MEYLQAQQVSTWVEVLKSPTQGQRSQFVQWLKESPRNLREFLIMFAIEQELNSLDADRKLDIQALVAQVESQPIPLRPVMQEATTRGRGLRRAVGVAVAASLVAGVLLFGGYHVHYALGWREYATAVGEQRAFELEDGSIVHLNTHSRVSIRLSAGMREVRLLQGEALFRVTHDVARPFRVYTADATIEDVGTQFDVYDRRDGTVVSVIEGSVNVTAARPVTAADPAADSVPAAGLVTGRSGAGEAGRRVVTRSLVASEEAHVDSSGAVRVAALGSVSDAVAWRERRLVFHDRSLAFISAEFNRYSRKQIRLEGEDVGRRVYSGVFDVDDMDSLAQVLAGDPDLRVESLDQQIVVRARP